jgi:hypothetical protein
VHVADARTTLGFSTSGALAPRVDVVEAHAPHGWDSHVVLEEATMTLLCGDLFAHAGDGPAIVGDDERDAVVSAAVETETLLRQSACLDALSRTLEQLAALEPQTLAVMHGSSLTGDGGGALRALAAAYMDTYVDEAGLTTERGRL